MKGVISIFALPTELKELQRLFKQLSHNKYFIDQDVQLTVDISVCLSDELTDWDNSKHTKECIKKYIFNICGKYLYTKYAVNLNFSVDNKVLGCVSQRRKSLQTFTDADFFVWLDCDMVFDQYTLYYLIEAYKNSPGMTVVTPQIVRQWDETWDCIVHDKYLNYPLDFYKTCDIQKEIQETNNYEDVNTSVLFNHFKFAGGWCTLLSGELLRHTTVPESFGHYGLEDTYIMYCMNYIPTAKHVVVNNLLIGADEKYKHLWRIKGVTPINRKEEFLRVAQNNFTREVNNFIARQN